MSVGLAMLRGNNMGILDKLRGNPLEKLKKEELVAERMLQVSEEKLKVAEIERLSERRKKFIDKSSNIKEGERRTLEMHIQQLDQKIKINNKHLDIARKRIRIINNLIFICDNQKMLERDGIMAKLAKLPKVKLDDFLGKVNLKDQSATDSIRQLPDNDAGLKGFFLALLRSDIMFIGIIEKIGILLRMIRPQGMISPLCACFAGIYLANMGLPSYIYVIESFILIILLWFGGILLNDFCDYEVDLITEPDRLIPSGKISRRDVLYSSIFLMSVAFLLSLFISIKLSIIVGALILLIILYNSVFKRMGIIGSFSFGIIEGLSFAIGVFVIGTTNMALIFIAFSIILLHTTVNMIGAIKDIEGDIETGNWTVPAKYGVDFTVYLAIFFLLISFIMAYIPIGLNVLNFRYLPNLITITLWLIITTIMVKSESKLGYMALGMYDMGASIYYISFITGI